MNMLNGKVIVITGASSGFGKGSAIKFSSAKTKLVLAARRENLLDELADECCSNGSEAIAVPTDVSKLEEIENLAKIAIEKFGRIDVWINDAGAAAVGPFTDVPLVDHIKVIQTDLIGTIQGSYFALKQFKAQNGGMLINVASMIGKIPAPYYSSYTAAKHGVVGFNASLRQELRAQKIENIHVCTVMPMAMNTPFFANAANYTDRKTLPIPPMDDAQKVIDVIVALVEKPQDEVPVGMGSAFNLVLHNIAPALSETMMQQITHMTQMEYAPNSPPTEGIVDKPGFTSGGTGIRDPKFK